MAHNQQKSKNQKINKLKPKATSSTMASDWKPFALTHITYPVDGSIYTPILALLSLLPSFGVCALVSAVVIYKDVCSLYLLVGSLISTVISAILKRLIREPRPERYDDDIDDIEFGMPSNHSCFAWFVATFVVMYVVKRGTVWAASNLPSRCCYKYPRNKTETPMRHYMLLLAKLWSVLHSSVTIILALCIAGGCSYSRVYLRYHTPAQVYAGSVLGMGLGAFWYYSFQTKLVRDFLIMVDSTIYELEHYLVMQQKRD